MSQANVEFARELFERLGRDGFASVWELLDPDLEWETSPNLPDAGTYRGRERARAFLEEQFDIVWGGPPHIDVERAFDCGEDVLLFVRIRGRGSHAGVPLDVSVAQLVTVRDGKAVRVKVFPDRGEALEAVGLSEQATSRQNVELIEVAVEAMNRGDLDAFLACLHPDVEWEENADAFPGLAGTYRGRAEVRRWAEQAVLELWANLELSVEDIAETVDGGALLETRIAAQGTASGVDTTIHAWQLFWFADGRIAKRRGPFWERPQM